ncbi:MAG: hypothetical protein WDW36_006236 [Sanguina aurantia]
MRGLTEVSRVGIQQFGDAEHQQLALLHKAMRAAVHNIDTHPLYGAPGLQQECDLFLTSFTAYITLVAARLETLDQAVGSHAVTQQFAITMSLLSGGCAVLSKWTCVTRRTLLLQHTPPLTSLYTALTQLNHALLVASQKRTDAWLSLDEPSQPSYRASLLNHVLSVSCHVLTSIASLPAPAQAQLHLRALPRTFIPLLCCLAYEQLGESDPVNTAAGNIATGGTSQAWPSKLQHPDFIFGLARVISSLVFHTDEPALLDLFSGPAVLQALKLYVAVKAADGSLESVPGPLQRSAATDLQATARDPAGCLRPAAAGVAVLVHDARTCCCV